jgi:hypothetical protein
MGRLQCPQCGTVVEEQPGRPTVCPTCGFSGEPPAPGPGPAAEPAPQPTYSSTPYGGGAGYGGYAPPASPVPPSAQPPPTGPPGQQPYGGQRPIPPNNGLAVGAFVCGIVGLCIPVLPIIAIILGVIARNQIKQTGERGEGLALAGIILGAVAVVLSLMSWMFFMPFGRWMW